MWLSFFFYTRTRDDHNQRPLGLVVKRALIPFNKCKGENTFFFIKKNTKRPKCRRVIDHLHEPLVSLAFMWAHTKGPYINKPTKKPLNYPKQINHTRPPKADHLTSLVGTSSPMICTTTSLLFLLLSRMTSPLLQSRLQLNTQVDNNGACLVWTFSFAPFIY